MGNSNRRFLKWPICNGRCRRLETPKGVFSLIPEPKKWCNNNNNNNNKKVLGKEYLQS